MRDVFLEIHKKRHVILLQWQRENFPWIITTRRAGELWGLTTGPTHYEFLAQEKLGLILLENGKVYALDVDHGETVETIMERRAK